MEGLTAGEEERRAAQKQAADKTEATEMVKVSSSLNFFELKLFKDEPPLVSIVEQAVYNFYLFIFLDFTTGILSQRSKQYNKCHDFSASNIYIYIYI